MKEYIKMGFGYALGITLCGTLVNMINNWADKKSKETQPEKDKVEESAE